MPIDRLYEEKIQFERKWLWDLEDNDLILNEKNDIYIYIPKGYSIDYSFGGPHEFSRACIFKGDNKEKCQECLWKNTEKMSPRKCEYYKEEFEGDTYSTNINIILRIKGKVIGFFDVSTFLGDLYYFKILKIKNILESILDKFKTKETYGKDPNLNIPPYSATILLQITICIILGFIFTFILPSIVYLFHPHEKVDIYFLVPLSFLHGAFLWYIINLLIYIRKLVARYREVIKDSTGQSKEDWNAIDNGIRPLFSIKYFIIIYIGIIVIDIFKKILFHEDLITLLIDIPLIFPIVIFIQIGIGYMFFTLTLYFIMTQFSHIVLKSFLRVQRLLTETLDITLKILLAGLFYSSLYVILKVIFINPPQKYVLFYYITGPVLLIVFFFYISYYLFMILSHMKYKLCWLYDKKLNLQYWPKDWAKGIKEKLDLYTNIESIARKIVYSELIGRIAVGAITIVLYILFGQYLNLLPFGGG